MLNSLIIRILIALLLFCSHPLFFYLKRAILSHVVYVLENFFEEHFLLCWLRCVYYVGLSVAYPAFALILLLFNILHYYISDVVGRAGLTILE